LESLAQKSPRPPFPKGGSRATSGEFLSKEKIRARYPGTSAHKLERFIRNQFKDWIFGKQKGYIYRTQKSMEGKTKT
jgi:hypothetical protein